jgi:HEAT repeat protein/type 1 glutamine amidotransferase
MKKLTLAFLLCSAWTLTAAPLPDDVTAALQALQKYEYGQPRLPLFTLEAFSGRSTAQPDQQQALAAAYLKIVTATDSTAAARVFACQQLALVGGAAEVPTLAALLNQPEQTDFARLALEAIPAPEAGAALRAALDKLSGKPLIGVINSLGQRRDEQVVSAMVKLCGQSDAAVRAAACLALGKIGTPEAAVALPADAVEARLVCAERAGGKSAQDIYAALSTAAQPATRLAGLTGLARLDTSQATPLLIKAIHDSDAALALGALRVLGQLKGDAGSDALAVELPKLDATRQVALLAILADRRAMSARSAVTTLAGSGDETIRVAALEALGMLGDASSLPVLLQAAAEKKGSARSAAEAALVQLATPGADDALIKAIAAGAPELRVAAINATVARMLTGALPTLFIAVRYGDENVRTAAAKALGKLGAAEDYLQLVALLGDVQSEELETAIAMVGHRVNEPQTRIAPLLALLKRDGAKPETQAAVLRTLAGIGGKEALAAVRARLATNKPELQDAAVRALAGWADGSALEDLLKVIAQPPTPLHKTLALRGALRLAANETQPLTMLKRILGLVQTADEKRLWLGTLGTLKSTEALALAVEQIGDAETRTEAATVAASIGQALVTSHPDVVADAMTKVIAPAPTAAPAKRTLMEAQQALGIKSAHHEARLKALSAGLPAGARVVAYCDCGVEKQDKSSDGVMLRVMNGQNWAWKGAADNPAALTAAYAGGHLKFDASGLKPKMHYQLGFTWWDFDANGREQSVWIGGKQVLAKTALPAWQGKQQGPAQITVAIPADAIKNGKVMIEFRGEGKSNVVCSEIWLVESATPMAIATATTTITIVPAAPRLTKPEVRANAGAQKKILIVTGCDYPGHKWQLTTPVLTAALAKDKRLEISVIEDALFLASADLKKYDAIMLNYMNWENPGPGAAAQENFRKIIAGGTGLVLVHFSCGAFQGWEEFGKIAGRAWNPKLRGHDPRGPFRVNIVDHQHPTMAKFADFETTDELYTCLAGATPIHVLAQATSKVDKQIYPMAFTLDYGKGRIFHSVLGHDVQAFSDAVGTLYRRGTAWAASLPPGE